MYSCLRHPIKLPLQRHCHVRTSIGGRISSVSRSRSSALRIQGCRYESTLWSEQGMQTEKLLNHRGSNKPPEAAPVSETAKNTSEPDSTSHPSPHLKSSGNIPPSGVKTLETPVNKLPEKPGKPPYPCPHLSDEEVETYLFPLYERGWGVYTKRPLRTDKASSAPSLMLARDISFVWHFPLVDFLTTLNVLVKQENHHPRVAYEFRSLELRIQTHDAKLEDPQEPKRRRSKSSPKSTSSPQITPGITLRDVRLAYLIENALQPYYELSKLTMPTTRPFQTPNSIRELGLMMKTYAAVEGKGISKERTTMCIVCGEDHWATQCPKRFTTQPMMPCDLCGGSHWRFTCLLYSDWKAKVKRAEH